nr:hypothetical protein CFP56_67969 [Quercus suber]
MLGSYTYWKFHGESAAAPTALECGSSHAQDSHEHYGDFRGMLHDLCPTHEMATEVMGEGEIAQQPTEDTLFDGSTDMQVAPVAPVASDILVDTESLVGRYLGKKCQLLRDDYQQSPTAENRLKKCGPPTLAEIWALDGSWKIPLLLNGQGQPIGPDGKMVIWWLETFFNNGLLCPLVPTGWPKVPEKFKQDCWTKIEKRYLIQPNIVKPPNQMGWAMHILGVLKRNQRSKLKKDHIKEGVTREEVLAKETPPRVMEDQWTEMVNYWFHEKTVVPLLYSSISF